MKVYKYYLKEISFTTHLKNSTAALHSAHSQTGAIIPRIHRHWQLKLFRKQKLH